MKHRDKRGCEFEHRQNTIFGDAGRNMWRLRESINPLASDSYGHVRREIVLPKPQLAFDTATKLNFALSKY